MSIDILIPAYKIDFLEHTLDCFINADKYSDAVRIIVFCDGENPKIDKLVQNYSKYKYVKFSENLGSRNLVAHWMRCIEYSNSDYIWLFSDDDTIIETELINLLCIFEDNKNKKACYRLRVDRINQFAGPNPGHTQSENIAAGNSSPKKTYIQWFNSPGHYKIMFNPKFKTIGVGYVKTEGSNYTHYWTADFGY